MIEKNIDFQTFSKKINDCNLKIGNNREAGKKTLVFVYYAGHGIMKGFTKAACDIAKRPMQAFYPLEQQLRTMGSQEEAYVMGIFDYCRA